MNLKLTSFNVACLAYSEDMKKYRFKKLFQPFMRDLKKLESNEGLTIKLGNEHFILWASIAGFCRDGLAVHQVYGLLEPSANRFCRMCLITREQLVAENFLPKEERGKETFDKHLAAIRNVTGIRKREIISETGVRNECTMNDSRFFHTSRNKSFDPIHDFLASIVINQTSLNG